jgi:protein-S-isoprenylcysteine O-methyltransferase Ste14
MPVKMSIWGVGPIIFALTAAYALGAVVATFAWPSVFALHVVPYPYLAAAGGGVLALCILLHVITGRLIVEAHRSGELVTTGPYAVCRHPLYAVWILLGLPAIALLLKSWLFLTTAVFMYGVTRLLVRREDRNLQQLFGSQYLDYQRRVNTILPTLWK